MRLIADGVVDREESPASPPASATAPARSNAAAGRTRGASPLALARAQRAQTARLLIETTPLPMADIAFAAGFSSIRTFNDTVREVSPSPRASWRTTRAARSRHSVPAADVSGSLTLRLPFRAPLYPGNLWHSVMTGVPGVEEWRESMGQSKVRL